MVDRLMSCEMKGWTDFVHETVTSGSGSGGGGGERKEWIISALLLLGNILSRKAREINLYYMN